MRCEVKHFVFCDFSFCDSFARFRTNKDPAMRRSVEPSKSLDLLFSFRQRTELFKLSSSKLVTRSTTQLRITKGQQCSIPRWPTRLLHHFSQYAQRWRIEERVVFDQVDTCSWLQRLKRQFPECAVRYDAKCFPAAQLFLGGLQKQIVKFTSRGLIIQITSGEHAAELINSRSQLICRDINRVQTDLQCTIIRQHDQIRLLIGDHKLDDRRGTIRYEYRSLCGSNRRHLSALHL